MIENIQSHTHEFLQQASVSGMIHAGGGGVVESSTPNQGRQRSGSSAHGPSPGGSSHGHGHGTPNSGPGAIRRSSSIVKSHKDLLDANSVDRLKEKSALNYTNYDNSIRTGCYSTSYNKVVDNITSGKTVPRSFGCLDAYKANGGSSGSNSMMIASNRGGLNNKTVQENGGSANTSNLATSSLDGSQAGDAQGQQTGQRNDLDSSIRHLMVKQDELRKSLEHILNDHPQADSADTMLSVLAVSPHISMIVDQPTQLKPGSELFTVLLGHPKQVGICEIFKQSCNEIDLLFFVGLETFWYSKSN